MGDTRGGSVVFNLVLAQLFGTHAGGLRLGNGIRLLTPLACIQGAADTAPAPSWEMIMTTASEADRRLYDYMMGWRVGVRGGVMTSFIEANPDMARGHRKGRLDRTAAYQAACEEYGATLSPLRHE